MQRASLSASSLTEDIVGNLEFKSGPGPVEFSEIDRSDAGEVVVLPKKC